MKSLLFLSACGLVVTSMAACAPVTPPTARVALDCPMKQGDLKLSNVSPDKKTCLYSSRDGDQVLLRLIPVSGSYMTVLQPIEQELQGEVTTQPQTGKASAEAKPGSATTSISLATSDSAKAAKQAAEEAHADAVKRDKDSDGDAKFDVSGDHNGDHARIDLPGIHISADNDKANVNVGGIDVNAGENGATVRMSRDARLRGEALSPKRNGFRSTFILARGDLKDGWKAVGYEAAGPKAGPVTVAVFKAHEGRHHDVWESVKRLVRRNAGV